jgi:hypothetical protein
MDSEPARIFPQEMASSGRAPESEPSNSWPVFCANHLAREVLRRFETYDKHRIIGTVTLSGCQERSLSENDDAHYEHCVCDLVLADTAAKNDHTRPDGRTSELIQGSNIANYVQDETRRLE